MPRSRCAQGRSLFERRHRFVVCCWHGATAGACRRFGSRFRALDQVSVPAMRRDEVYRRSGARDRHRCRGDGRCSGLRGRGTSRSRALSRCAVVPEWPGPRSAASTGGGAGFRCRAHRLRWRRVVRRPSRVIRRAVQIPSLYCGGHSASQRAPRGWRCLSAAACAGPCGVGAARACRRCHSAAPRNAALLRVDSGGLRRARQPDRPIAIWIGSSFRDGRPTADLRGHPERRTSHRR